VIVLKVIIKNVVAIVREIALHLVVVLLLHHVAHQEVVVEALTELIVREMLSVLNETVRVVVIDQERKDEGVAKVEVGVEVGAEVEAVVEVELLIPANVEVAVAAVVEIADAVAREVAAQVIVVAPAVLLDTSEISLTAYYWLITNRSITTVLLVIIDVKSGKLIFQLGVYMVLILLFAV